MTGVWEETREKIYVCVEERMGIRKGRFACTYQEGATMH